MDTGVLLGLSWAGAIAALLFAFYQYLYIKKQDPGTEKMVEISTAVQDGAMAYLKRQYIVVTIFFTVLLVILMIVSFGFGLLSKWVPFAFLTGGFFSGLSGYFGMRVATISNCRTAAGARESLNKGLRIAFSSGTVMGMTVVGLGLLDISMWYTILNYFVEAANELEKIQIITATMLTFGMGASTMALFARLGGGIFTKAADVGADLVGKVEAGIPEDDPRNPATIADNVGDNVGDVAGMGADLYESYVGSIVATMALGALAFGAQDAMKAIAIPMVMASIGIFCSIAGTFLVKSGEDASQEELLWALRKGIYFATIIIAVVAGVIVHLALGLGQYWGIWAAVVIGLVVGNVIGYFTEFYTSDHYKPTRDLSATSQTGPATIIIGGLALGMRSTFIPVICIVVGTLGAFFFAKGSGTAGMGLYGIGMAAVGMLSTLGITLATDAYGPVADNAGGIAEMAGLEPEVRRRTDALDSLGNTTAATGKGFAIGSAALTALALLAAYVDELKHSKLLIKKGVDIAALGLDNVHLMDPVVLVGLFIGAMLPFFFSAMTMSAVGRAAQSMVEEVRRQFREIKGILEGTGKPDYQSCVYISTKGAQKEMMAPTLLAVISPLVVGVVFGPKAVVSLLAGALVTGFVLAIMMANAGGAWDNAKKHIEGGAHGGKGSDEHKAAIVGDTVGDPFKDTSGPSINILLKLMSMVSIVFATTVVSLHLPFMEIVKGIFQF